MKSASKMATIFALGRVQAIFERAGFVSFTIGAVDVNDGEARRGVTFDAGASDLASFIRGIIEDLDVEEFARVVKERDGVDKSLDDVAFVENGELYSNLWPVDDGRRWARNVFAVSVIFVKQDVTMHAIHREDEENEEVRNHHREIKGIGVIDATEGTVGDFVPVMAQRALLGGE